MTLGSASVIKWWPSAKNSLLLSQAMRLSLETLDLLSVYKMQHVGGRIDMHLEVNSAHIHYITNCTKEAWRLELWPFGPSSGQWVTGTIPLVGSFEGMEILEQDRLGEGVWFNSWNRMTVQDCSPDSITDWAIHSTFVWKKVIFSCLPPRSVES